MITQAQKHKLDQFNQLRNNLALSLKTANYNSVHLGYQKLSEKLDLIIQIEHSMEEDLRITSGYDTAKDELITSVLLVSRKLTTFSLLEEITFLHGNYGYTKEELILFSDKKLLLIAGELLGLIESHHHDIVEYGINENIELNFRNNIDVFKLITETLHLSEENEVSNTNQISELINDIDILLESDLSYLKTKTFVN